MDKKQTELPDDWLQPNNWLIDTGRSFEVEFGFGRLHAKLLGIDVPGYGGKVKNRLHLFDLDGVDPSIVTDGITFDKEDLAHNLTLFLYPDDSDHKGRMS